MKEELLNLQQISAITNLEFNTLRTYLGSYKFSRFITKTKVGKRTKEVYKFNNSFVNELARYLYLRKKWGNIKLLNQYCGKNFFIELDKEAELC